MGNAMNKPKKHTALIIITALLLSTILSITGIHAVEPPTVPGHETYQTIEGLLDTDEYILYPYDEVNVDIGFSKYGEMIDGDTEIGLSYKGVDVFANPAVPKELWCSGWIMDIHYTEGGYLRNIWAYALFSDRTVSGVEGDWQNGQLTKDASDPADTHGGRRTNGYAETEDIKVIYDGPREAIYLLQTRIYDKDPMDGGTPLVELTIQLVYNKVMKQVQEIKDVKRIDNNKMKGPFQIEFSQRAEWDIGLTSDSRSYAEFYSDLPTKYYKHPFYYPEGEIPVTYDLCQIIDEEDLVGYAAYWSQLISKWVTNAEEVRRYGEDVDVPCLLSTMETYEHRVELPTSADELVDPSIYYNDVTGEIVILLPKEPVAYPRGLGEWDNSPWVFKEDGTGDYAKMLMQSITTPGSWRWEPMHPPHGAVVIKPFQWQWGDKFCLVFKRVMEGHTPQCSEAAECMEPIFQPGETVDTLGMYNEPDTPYVFAEWDFDLDFDHPENSTHQFRCVSIYGLTDNHNAMDPNKDEGIFRIDKEVIYQLNEVLNPWDLKEAAHLDTFRWAQKGGITPSIVLTSHLYDKYGNPRDCLEGEHMVWFPEKWGYYCNDSEKVLLYNASGARLLTRPEEYNATGNTIDILVSTSGYTHYKVLYTTKLDTDADYHDGRWEWTVIGENSHASDSLGSAMLSSAWSDWKNKETWLSGLDIQSLDIGPSIPWTMRAFDTALTPDRLNYHFDHDAGDHRSAFRDDWCTPDEWDHLTKIHPYAISSSDLVIVGGPIASQAAEYFNDFTDALIFTGYGEGFYAQGCWARTTQDYYQGMTMEDVTDDELWYSSPTIDDTVGYSIVSTYKDLNGTVGFMVYGYTAEDTYYTCYALRGGLLTWLQQIQCGSTTIILEIDYSDLHPVAFHVKEVLGTITECTGFYTNFKDTDYSYNKEQARMSVEAEAMSLGLCYKLVDIEWCAQLHPDP
jgi:hypothetical protein